MTTLYTALVLSVLLLISTSHPLSKPLFDSLGVSTSMVSICLFLFIVSLFVHFTHPRNYLYFAVLILVNSWLFIHSTVSSNVLYLLRRMFFGMLMAGVIYKLSIWYPFEKWHGVPAGVVDALIWFIVSHATSTKTAERFGILGAAFLASVWFTLISASDGVLRLVPIEGTLQSHWVHITDVWLMACSLTWIAYTVHQLSRRILRVFNPSI